MSSVRPSETGPETGEGPAFEQGGAALEGLIDAYPDLANTARSLHADGFAICDFGFPDDLLDAVAEFCRTKVAGLGRIQDGWRKDAAIGALAVYPSVLEHLAKLYGRRPIPFQTLNFDVGTEQATHSDTIHFNSTPARYMCGVWVALEDICEDAGPLHYYPGSHRLPIFSLADTSQTDTYSEYEAFVADFLKSQGLERRTATLKRGQAFLWSANLFHGGNRRNNPSLSRLSQVSHYYFEGCAYHTPLLFDRARGEPFIREPYDLSTRRFVASDTRQLAGRAGLTYRLAQRAKLCVHAPPRF